MRVKANAYREYNQAAVLDKVITNLPEVVKAIAEPLAKVDKISIVSTGGANGNGSGLGASRVTGDVVAMLAQVPAILETLTGVKLSDLMERVPGLGTVDGTATPAASNGSNGADHAETADANASTPEAVPVTSGASNAAPAGATNNVTPGQHTGGPRREPCR
jgi:flotillin